MTYTELTPDEMERKEFVQVTVASPVNPRYLAEGWEVLSQDLPAGMATLRRPLPNVLRVHWQEKTTMLIKS